MSISAKTKHKAIAEKFGVQQVDPEDIGWTNFMYSRRHCGTVPDERWGRELAYIIEITDLEAAIRKTLDRIRKRDGARIFKEAKAYLQDATTSSLQAAPNHPPRRRPELRVAARVSQHRDKRNEAPA